MLKDFNVMDQKNKYFSYLFHIFFMQKNVLKAKCGIFQLVE